jgi:hypothetical protein
MTWPALWPILTFSSKNSDVDSTSSRELGRSPIILVVTSSGILTALPHGEPRRTSNALLTNVNLSLVPYPRNGPVQLTRTIILNSIPLKSFQSRVLETTKALLVHSNGMSRLDAIISTIQPIPWGSFVSLLGKGILFVSSVFVAT